MDDRLTFRPIMEEGAWQKQLRDSFQDEEVPDTDMSLKKARVRSISKKAASQIILKYEWLGTMAGTSAHFGIFFGHYCGGVTCVGLSGSGVAGPQAYQPYGIKRKEFAVLSRGACVHWAPPGSNSKLVAWTARLLKPHGIKVMVAYADTDAGEIGTIYQAANWVYVGRTVHHESPVSPDGRIYTHKKLSSEARNRGCSMTRLREIMLKEGWTFQKDNRKHRYVCIVDRSDKALVALVMSKSQPYPKRENR